MPERDGKREGQVRNERERVARVDCKRSKNREDGHAEVRIQCFALVRGQALVRPHDEPRLPERRPEFRFPRVRQRPLHSAGGIDRQVQLLSRRTPVG
jgi:hypothetical protein